MIAATGHAFITFGTWRGKLVRQLRLAWGQDKPETEIAVCVQRVAAAARRTAVRRRIVPTAATDDTIRSRRRALRINDGPARIRPIPVLAPLPHISMHIHQSPGVGQLLADRVGSAAAVGRVPRVVGQVGVARIIPVAESR